MKDILSLVGEITYGKNFSNTRGCFQEQSSQQILCNYASTRLNLSSLNVLIFWWWKTNDSESVAPSIIGLLKINLPANSYMNIETSLTQPFFANEK